jgi:hypothetical protein
MPWFFLSPLALVASLIVSGLVSLLVCTRWGPVARLVVSLFGPIAVWAVTISLSGTPTCNPECDPSSGDAALLSILVGSTIGLWCGAIAAWRLWDRQAQSP